MEIQPIPINNNTIITPHQSGVSVRFIRGIDNRLIRVETPNVRQISDRRVWMYEQPVTNVPTVPVTTLVGTPIINMPGCVKVHKENAKNPTNKNKMLVNDDPKQNVVLCDGGMPYYEPPNYDARELTWLTVYMDQDDDQSGIDTGTPEVAAPETPGAPETPEEYKDPECPGPLEARLGAVGPNEKEKVVGHELQPDPNNLNKKICVTLYEDIGVVEQYLPSPQIVTTTAVIASVAASSALLAKPLADLLLRVVKPVVKKVIGKVNAILGKTTYRPSRSEVLADEYRKKKGLLPLKKNQKKKPLKKTPQKKS